MRLQQIVRYPIKSCRGTDVPRARVGARGLEHDRRWMVVDAAGRFVTQRTAPRLAQVDVALEGDRLRVSHPTQADLVLPALLHDGPRAAVEVWGSPVEACVDREGSAWMSALLGDPLRLVCMPDDAKRPVDPAYGRDGDIVSFADGFPLLLTSESSLDDLSRRAGMPLEMSRFRPNLVVAGAPAWAEDGWPELEVGPLRFRAPKPCARCVITTLDPRTGEAGKEPLRTLASFRRREGGVMFGINLVPELAPDASVELVVGAAVSASAPLARG